MVVEHVDSLRMSLFAWPVNEVVLDAVFCQIAACSACCVERVAVSLKHLAGSQHFGFLLAVAG